MDEGLVALYVDHHVPFAADLFYCFLYAVGAALVVGACHYRLASESLYSIEDAVVVGSYPRVGDHAADFLINVLYYRLARERGQWLAGETR